MEYIPLLIVQKNIGLQEEKVRRTAQNLLGEKIENNPNFIVIAPLKRKHLGVEDISYLRSQIKYKPLTNTVTCIYIPNMENATIEAQNAMLKILEEPSLNIQIFLGVDNYKKLLPTLISRCKLVIDEFKNTNTQFDEQIDKILKEDIKAKIEIIDKISEMEREDALEFLFQLSVKLKKKMLSTENEERVKIAKLQKEIVRTSKHLNSNVTLRVALENLMLFMYNR